MPNLLLNRLEVKNFRGFKQLKIKQLGRVNLIVGKNNVGKTSLLEALSVYARGGSPSAIWDILESRNESSRFRSITRNSDDLESRVEDIKYLFHGRKDIREQIGTIEIGTGENHNTLVMDIGWYAVQADEQGIRRLQPLLSPELASVDNLVLGLAARLGSEVDTVYRIDRYLDNRRQPQLEANGIKHIYVPANGLNNNLIGEFWDNITLTRLQEQVIEAIKIIEPELEGLNLITDMERKVERIPVIRISNFDSRLPLKSLGEGMSRMLGISLALSNASDGLLLIDEIESGLHYTVQADMWRLVFQMARRLDVQVFATTHSWDCIEGFQKAAQESRLEDGFLIRLGRKKDEIVATLYDEEELSIITRDQIEVR